MKIGIVFGAFDLLHAGHLYHLEQCKKNCDYLIVGLHENPALERASKNSPIETLLERQIRLRSCKYVDEVIVYKTEQDIKDIFNSIDVDVRFLGNDYILEDKPITGEKELEDKHIQTIFTLSNNLHTSDLRERIKNL